MEKEEEKGAQRTEEATNLLAGAIKIKLGLMNKEIEAAWRTDWNALFARIDPARLETVGGHIESFQSMTIELIRHKAQSMKERAIEMLTGIDADENLQADVRDFILTALFDDPSSYIQRLKTFLESVERKFRSQGIADLTPRTPIGLVIPATESGYYSVKPKLWRVDLIEAQFKTGVMNTLCEVKGAINADFTLFSARMRSKPTFTPGATAGKVTKGSGSGQLADYFPELRISELKRYGERWGKRYQPAIQRICLHNYVPKRLAAYKETWGSFPVRYALVFEARPDYKENVFEELEMATERNQTIRRGYPALFDNRFFTVYVEKPGDDYYKHWIMFIRKAGEEMPPGIITDEPFWVLYDSNKVKKENRNESTSLTDGMGTDFSSISPELFPALIPLEFTRRVREWIERWPDIQEVRLYAGKGIEHPYVLVFGTGNKASLLVAGFWADSLIPIQEDLWSTCRNKRAFSLGQWQMFVTEKNEDLPEKLIHTDNCWHLYGRTPDTPIPPGQGNPPREKKLRSCQKHRMACREIAYAIWSVDPFVTISDMGHRDEINRLFDGKVYLDSTIRNWIKDLCPNRTPGRRGKR